MVDFKKRIKTLCSKECLTIFLILLLGAFLRLYKIDGYMTFLGDEGRDGLVWLRMVKQGKFTLIGPQTSIGNMYLGPLYYYLMLPFYILFGLSPVGPSVGVALLGVATIFLIWKIGKEWFGEIAGSTAALLYATSPVVIIYSRSSWNPNIMPFFALLTIYGIWQFWQKENFVWLPVIGVTLSFCLQSHYLGLLLLPVVGIFWLVELLKLLRKNDKRLKYYILHTTYSILLLLLLTLVPLVWFDLRHNFINAKAFYKFFTERQTTVNLKAYKAIPHLWPLWELMITRLLAAKEIVLGRVMALVLVLGAVFFFTRSDLVRGRTSPISPVNRALALIFVWLVIGLGGIGLYKQHIYDHYFGFLFPAVFLLAGFLLGKIWEIRGFRDLGKLGVLGILALAMWFNLKNSPLNWPPNYQMAKVQKVDQTIIQEASSQPFNFALIAKQNYEAGYEYFLEDWRAPLVRIDPQEASQTIADQLFVVCEDEKCEPVGHPKTEIANFGWAKIDQEWEFPWGVKLYRLTHLK